MGSFLFIGKKNPIELMENSSNEITQNRFQIICNRFVGLCYGFIPPHGIKFKQKQKEFLHFYPKLTLIVDLNCYTSRRI
jgi:hypothetical protein